MLIKLYDVNVGRQLLLHTLNLASIRGSLALRPHKLHNLLCGKTSKVQQQLLQTTSVILCACRFVNRLNQEHGIEDFVEFHQADGGLAAAYILHPNGHTLEIHLQVQVVSATIFTYQISTASRLWTT